MMLLMMTKLCPEVPLPFFKSVDGQLLALKRRLH